MKKLNNLKIERITLYHSIKLTQKYYNVNIFNK